MQLQFRATNNMAEYEGLIAGLRAAMGLGIRHLLVKGDSQLVVNQVSKEYQCTDPQMTTYVAEVRKLERHFDGLELRYISRRDNALADDLSRLASSHVRVLAGVFEERLTRPSVLPAEQDEGCRRSASALRLLAVLKMPCGWTRSEDT